MNSQFVQDVATLFHARPLRYAGVGPAQADALAAFEAAGVQVGDRDLCEDGPEALAALCEAMVGHQLSLLSLDMPNGETALYALAELLARHGADMVHAQVVADRLEPVCDTMARHGYAVFREYRPEGAQVADLARIELTFSSPAFASHNPCYHLYRRIADAQEATSAARKELKLANDRLALVAAALRNERSLYQKQIWKTSKRIKGQLSYRLGSVIVNHSESVLGTLTMGKALLSEYRTFKEERRQAKLLELGSKETQKLGLLSKERGRHGLLVHVEKMTPEEKAALDEGSFGHYIIALSNAFQFEKCVAEFETAYPPSTLQRPPAFEIPVARAYTRSLLRVGRADDAETLLTELVRRYPHQADYSSLLGYVLAGHKPMQARSSLRTAIMLGSKNSHVDAILLYRTLLLEKLPLKEAWGDVVSVLDQMSHNKFAMEAMDFVQSTMKLQQGRQRDALRSLNSAMARNKMGPIAPWKAHRAFGIDNFTVPACQPGKFRGPLVSVLMTTHNSEEFLDTAVRGVLEQTYADLELIVIDDCSTDGTRAKLAAWADYDKRVVVLHNKHNVGTYGSKNLGLLKARGKYITCHDSDDWSHPQKIAFQVMRLRKTKAMACLSRWVRIDERGFFEATRWGQISHMNPSSLLYQRSVIDAIGYYDTVRTGADTEFQHRIINRFGAASVFETPSTMAFGRSHSESLTRSSRFGFDEFGASPFRQAYWAAWGEWHVRAMKESPERLYIPFPPKDERHFVIPPEIAVSAQAARLNLDTLF